jgi:glycosyltransferase involved in cell wall biosynthesis
VSVVTSGHDVADARLHREVAALLRAGLSVEVRGLGEAAAGPPGVPVRTRPRRGPVGRAASAVVLPWQARGRVLLCLDPDTLPSATLRRAVGRRVVADVHEDYLALLADRSWVAGTTGRVARGLARLATRLAARSDLTVVADEHVPPRRARRRLVVRNLPDGSMLPAPVRPGPVPRALYIGDLRASRGLFAMLDAVAAAPGWELDLVGPVAPAEQDRLAGWLATSPAADRVRLHGRLEPRRAWQLADGAWVGLALLEATPAFEAAVPTKLYEYLACGLTVLTTPLPRMADLVERSGAGRTVAGPEEAAAALRELSAQPERLLRMRAAAVDFAERTREPSPYDELAERVAELVVSGRRGRRARPAGA